MDRHVPEAPRKFGANQRVKREQMRAVSRVGNLLLAGALALSPVTALAQQAPASTNSPAADAVGPKELQNFSLSGTVTTPSSQTAVPAAPKRQPGTTTAQSAPPAAAPRPTASAATRPSTARVADAIASSTLPRPSQAPLSEPPPQKRDPAPETPRQSAPASSVTVALPKLAGDAHSGTSPTPTATPAFAPAPDPVGTLAPEHRFPILPWLLAAIALAAGAAFLFWRNRERTAFAGGPHVDAFVAPTPPPVPPRAHVPPSPAPPVAPAPPKPSTAGIVSTRLRPWVDIGFQPVRCILDERQVTVEFEIELFNSGSAPARAVLAEATLLNAGPNQDRDIEAFFANPVGEGDRIVAIPPLKRVKIGTKVIAPREAIQAYDLAGKQVFVPVLAFNALYQWSGGEGQSSASYLVGRDSSGEKLAPFRLDLGPRIFRGLASRLLPTGIRS
jgi:hypothetical protein